MGYRLRKNIKLSELLVILNIDHKVYRDIDIVGVSSSNRLFDGFLSFSKVPIDKDVDAAIFTDDNTLIGNEFAGEYIYHENPRLIFILALDYLVSNIGFDTYDFDSIIHESVSIGNNVVIEKGCVIEEGVILEPNVVIHSGTVIHRNSRIRSNSVIGGDGFGFEYLSDNTLIRFPHLGGVVIGSNVEIGALNSIARGTLSNTVIRDGVKTDNLVHIAHNCDIGDNSIITASSELSGGVSIGKKVWIGPNSSVIQKISIGDGSFIGIGSVVTKNVRENILVAGNPAKFIREL